MRSSTFYWVIPILALCACQGQYNHNAKEAYTYADTADTTAFPADMANLTSPSRKRIRTADVRCRVTNVFTATSRMEQLVTSLNGIVVESSMQNVALQQHEFPYSSDSVKRVQLYTPTANLTLRVPVAQLDTVVYTLTGMAGFIDHRILKETDATLHYLANALKNQQTNNDNRTVVPDKKVTTLDVAKYQDQKQDQVIDRKIANLDIQDNVAFATFTVQLFQPEMADIQVVVNPAQITRAGFGTEILTALRCGGELLRELIIFFLQLWPLWLILVAGWIAYKKVSTRFSKSPHHAS
jgi:hypothetical protein